MPLLCRAGQEGLESSLLRGSSAPRRDGAGGNTAGTHIAGYGVRRGAERACRSVRALPGTRTDRGLVGKDVPAELDEESVVVTLVRILAVVMRLRGSVGDILF
jgi:hypothetical protein